MTKSRELRILFTSVGRRVELLQEFRRASETLGIKLVIWGVDITENAPALCFCDKWELICRINDPNYISQLVELCKREKIDALIPTIDTDLLLLSRSQSEFSAVGTKVIISGEDKVQICRDKRYTADYFVSCGLLSPIPTDDYQHYTGGFPAFIKPKDGSSSIFAYKVNNEAELCAYASQVPNYIIQPFVKGTEYTVDAFCSFSGEPIYITPRKRLEVRAGEVSKTEIDMDETIISEMKHLLIDFKPCGAITVQLIRDENSGKDYFIEINPRFGGGAPLSMKAGADSAGAMLKLLCGEAVDYCPDAAQDHAVYSRFDQSVRVK